MIDGGPASWGIAFPRLFARLKWGQTDAQFGLADPPEDEVGNVHVICRTGEGIVVCESNEGWRLLPGGTREPGESIEETARRELVEEAGATLRSTLAWCGAFRYIQGGPRYRLHLPYPVSYMLYAVADVDIDGEPTSPPDGEQVTDVRVMPPHGAADWMHTRDRNMADIVRLAVARAVL